ncbi:hypothetical protein [Paenibacillus sp. TY11]|uniref:hypothetical protein n=1 Tax=Paenibacillus sp. TY11 TaxID=3448633 RepID=UPI0040392D32
MSAETLQDFIFRVSSGTLVPMNGKVAKRSGSKGGLWLATRNNMAVAFSQVGVSRQLSPSGLWVAALLEEERFAFFSNEFKKTSDWDDVWRPSELSNVTTYQFYLYRGFEMAGREDVTLNIRNREVELECFLFSKTF